jgi:DNA-binding CsgD family transcriptional regulator
MAEVVKRLNQPIFKAEDCVRYQYHSLIRYLNNLTLGQHTVRFSPRQLECLSLWLHCKTINEIGTILTISSNSANTYLSLAKENLGCHSKSQVYQQLDQLGTMHLFRKLYKLLMQEGRPDARINH